MLIKSLSGKTIIRTKEKTMRRALEYCALKGVDLSGADLRKARLSMANLDGLKALGASFWGADLTGSDIGFADLRQCDLRCIELKDACLAQSDLTGADLRGAYFSGTIVEDALLDNVKVSCPSFWSCDLHSAASIKGLGFIHQGERTIRLTQIPVFIQGFSWPLILHRNECIWGNRLYPSGSLPAEAQRALLTLKENIDGLLSRNAKKTIPKIGN